MLLKRIILINLLSFIFSVGLMAQETHKMNLQQMLDFARQNNYQLKEANLNKLKGEQKIKEVRGNGLPQIKSEIDYKNYLKLPTTIVPGSLMGGGEDMALSFGLKHNMDASIQLSQLLFSLKYINALKTVKRASEIRGLEVEKAQVEMVHLLLKEYYNLMAIYKNLEIIESNMQSLSQMKKKVNALVKGGLALKTDADKITINYTNLQANKEQVTAAINVQTNNLKYIIGMEADEQLVVDTTNFQLLFDGSLLTQSFAEGLDFQNLTEIKLLDKSLELNKLQIKTEQAEKYPNIALYGSYMFQGIRDKFNFFDGSKDWYNIKVIGVKATIPIFTGFSNNAKIRSAKYDMEVTQNKKLSVMTGLQLQYSNALMQYNSNVKNCQIQLDNIELAKEVRHQEDVKYNEGISTLTDFLISEQDLRNAEINYVQNFISMKQAEIDLLKSKGLLINYSISGN
ncbi:TolC family protein [Labilibaculum manganireducens]|uniref:Transporter n=1 Tax=Labilibaculum manganireducens TaxID=1940525 RepID=A0A2N3I6Q2_9BACT|nr:TolC family protein [Labilibaculum manganireducens]PKQ65990.1 hypothetical protein BZG01_12560 [Labilibaculum manganireducens]